MTMVPIKATDVARKLSEILNRVKYQGQSFEVKRGREIVAHIVPASAPRSLKISELAKLFQALPPLAEDERISFRRDLRVLRAKAKAPKSSWR